MLSFINKYIYIFDIFTFLLSICIEDILSNRFSLINFIESPSFKVWYIALILEVIRGSISGSVSFLLLFPLSSELLLLLFLLFPI